MYGLVRAPEQTQVPAVGKTKLSQMRVWCNNCQKREGLYENSKWCKKCSKVHKKEPIIDIPHDVFIGHIVPHLSLEQITILSEVSTRMNEYMNHQDIWRSVYQMSLGAKCYPNLVDRLSNSTMKKVKYEGVSESLGIVIRNTTKDISFDIYHVRERGWNRKSEVTTKLHKVDLQPGENFRCRTFHGHRWICVPTEDWLRLNQVSNVGCTFVADLAKLSWHTFEKAKRVYIQLNNIKEPKIRHPIQGRNKKSSDYKREFLRILIDPIRLKEKHDDIQLKIKSEDSRIKRMYREIRIIERYQEERLREDAHYKKMKKMLF